MDVSKLQNFHVLSTKVSDICLEKSPKMEMLAAGSRRNLFELRIIIFTVILKVQNVSMTLYSGKRKNRRTEGSKEERKERRKEGRKIGGYSGFISQYVKPYLVTDQKLVQLSKMSQQEDDSMT